VPGTGVAGYHGLRGCGVFLLDVPAYRRLRTRDTLGYEPVDGHKAVFGIDPALDLVPEGVEGMASAGGILGGLAQLGCLDISLARRLVGVQPPPFHG
jgi:hypothetical protein